MTDMQVVATIAGALLLLGASSAKAAVKTLISGVYLEKMGPLNRLIRDRTAPVEDYQRGAQRKLQPLFRVSSLIGALMAGFGLLDAIEQSWLFLTRFPILMALAGFSLVAGVLLRAVSLKEFGCLELPIQPNRNSGQLALYASRESFEPGQSIDVYVHTPADHFDIAISRVAPAPAVILTVDGTPGVRQGLPGCAFVSELNWTRPSSFRIPADWTSGLYTVQVSDGASRAATSFVVRPPRAHRAQTLVLANTNTWAAYNAWGGASLYSYGVRDGSGRPFATEVSTRRPNPGADPSDLRGHLAGGETHLLHWLHQSGIEFGMIADRDLHEDHDVLDGVSLLVLNTHPEYWSEAMLNQVTTFLERGGSLLALSGNSMYWRTTMSESTIEVHKNRGRHRMDGRRGGTWAKHRRPEASILGVGYTTAGYNTYAPYVVTASDHWLFAGTNVQPGDRFGVRSHVSATGEEGASGWETDKTGKGTPANAVLIARGSQEGGAEMVYYSHPGGGHVLAAGSITSASAVPLCPTFERVVLNFLVTTLHRGVEI